MFWLVETDIAIKRNVLSLNSFTIMPDVLEFISLCILFFFTCSEFFTPVWSLNDSKSPQISKTLLPILADLNNVVVWMVSTCPLFFKSSSAFNNPTMTVPKDPITIGIIVPFMVHSFFQFPSNVKVFILLFIFFQFYSMVSRDSKVINIANSFLLLLLLIIIGSVRLGEIRWPFVSQNPIGFCVSLYPGKMLGCAYTICSYCQI